MAKSTKIATPQLYRGYIMRPLADGTMDMIDPHNGMWINFKTQRHAKWSATVVVNLHHRFVANQPLRRDQIPLIKLE